MTIGDDYRDRRILVIGYGRTGAAVSRFFLDAGACVRVAERRRPAELGDVDARIDLRHGDADLHGLDAYGTTKLRLFANQTAADVAVLNGGDAWIRTHARGLAATTVWFGAGEGAVLRADAAAIRMRVVGREETYPLAKVALDGAHNRENMMAAIAAARAVGIAPAAVQQALEAFRPLPHRLELVRERDGVRWIDDSKGTNVGAVVK